MKQLTKNLILILLFAVAQVSVAQESPQNSSFSLQQAIDFALAHNQNYKNAEMDVQAAEYKNKEVTGIGLPQISGSADIKDYLTIPTTLLPGEFTGNPGTYTPVKFGTQYNASYGLSISQIIFNGEYIVGLEAAKEFMSLSKKSLKRSKVETYATITKAYYGVIVAKEKAKIIDANLDRIKKLLDDTKAMNVAGFVEKLDVDRIDLTYNNLLAERDKVLRLTAISETLLKFQMGYDMAAPITLTDQINSDLMINADLMGQAKTNYEARPEYDLMVSQQNINELEKRRYKAQYLPSLSAYGSFMQQAQRTKFDVFDLDQPWFGINLIGATLNVPIFNGGQKHYKIQQTKLNISKTANSLDYLQRSIDMEVETNTVQYKNALITLETQKKNKELAISIYDTSKIKYDTGVGTNLDVIYAQAALREAEINYLASVYDLIIAKTDYLKATGTLVK